LLSTTAIVEVLFSLIATLLSLLYVLKRRAARRLTSPEQVQAKFDALLQLKDTALRVIPGVMLIFFGGVLFSDLRDHHDPDWWHGLIFVVAGWIFLRLFTRKSWKRYLELNQLAESHDEPATDYKLQ
jgi:uncharacterized protein YjeT (DUF2065 family)